MLEMNTGKMHINGTYTCLVDNLALTASHVHPYTHTHTHTNTRVPAASVLAPSLCHITSCVYPAFVLCHQALLYSLVFLWICFILEIAQIARLQDFCSTSSFFTLCSFSFFSPVAILNFVIIFEDLCNIVLVFYCRLNYFC